MCILVGKGVNSVGLGLVLEGIWRNSGRREDEELQALRGNGLQDWLPGWYVNEAADSQK